jgi:uncharacterized protein
MNMTTEEVKRVIVDQREEIEEILQREKLIHRDIPREKLSGFLSHPNILVISGVRRSGKSILSWMILNKETYGYINFDDERLAGFDGKNLNSTVSAFYELYGKDLNYFIFDEIQNVPDWQLFINRLRRTKKIILTGSNANLLSGELSTHLTGRYMDFVLYPFSFKEYLKIKDFTLDNTGVYSTKNTARIKQFLEEYISIGGMPEAYRFGKSFINKVYSDIINKDVVFRYKIKHKTAFKELAKFMVSGFGDEIVFSRIKKTLAIKNVHTIKNYVDYLSMTYLVFLVEKFSYKLKQQIQSPRKAYCVDTGIANAVAFQFSENKGRLMENIVAVELFRRKSYTDTDLEIYYWKNRHGTKKVDFLLKQGRKVTDIIQVCYNISNINVRERELNSLTAAGKELHCDNMTVITWDEEGKTKYKGRTINLIPLWKWLCRT